MSALSRPSGHALRVTPFGSRPSGHALRARKTWALSLAASALMLLCASAQASYWIVHISGTGTGTSTSDGTPTTTKWTPPADAINSNTFSFGSSGYVTGSTSAKYDATVTATITLPRPSP